MKADLAFGKHSLLGKVGEGLSSPSLLFRLLLMELLPPFTLRFSLSLVTAWPQEAFSLCLE